MPWSGSIRTFLATVVAGSVMVSVAAAQSVMTPYYGNDAYNYADQYEFYNELYDQDLPDDFYEFEEPYGDGPLYDDRRYAPRSRYAPRNRYEPRNTYPPRNRYGARGVDRNLSPYADDNPYDVDPRFAEPRPTPNRYEYREAFGRNYDYGQGAYRNPNRRSYDDNYYDAYGDYIEAYKDYVESYDEPGARRYYDVYDY